jgi:DNA-directed RNA polymerase subunit RPC12/RpoP
MKCSNCSAHIANEFTNYAGAWGTPSELEFVCLECVETFEESKRSELKSLTIQCSDCQVIVSQEVDNWHQPLNYRDWDDGSKTCNHCSTIRFEKNRLARQKLSQQPQKIELKDGSYYLTKDGLIIKMRSIEFDDRYLAKKKFSFVGSNRRYYYAPNDEGFLNPQEDDEDYIVREVSSPLELLVKIESLEEENVKLKERNTYLLEALKLY